MAEETPVGIKETKEAVLGLIVIGATITKHIKDQGWQITDLVKAAEELLADPAKKAKLLAAYEGASQIPAEIKDISLAEGFELAMAVVPEALNAFKG